jgi:hypothetical protein
MIVETLAIAAVAAFALVALLGHGLLIQALLTREPRT